jgi:ABC-type multidrug transport system ATPase subunit
VALLFTWREIARMRNSSITNILILDEIMDSSLDAAGTDEFLKIIRNLSKSSNIIVISHKSDQIQDKFDMSIGFEKKNNFSHMVVAE